MSATSPSDYPTAAKLGLILGVGAAIGPVIMFGLKTPMMSTLEIVAFAVLFTVGVMGGFIANKRPLVGLAVLPIGLFGLSFFTWSIFAAIRDEKVSLLREQISNYTDLRFLPIDPNRAEKPHLRGKVVAIDQKKRIIDPLHFLLPDELRAHAPEEVGTVVYLKWRELSVRDYPSGRTGYQRVCEVKVIDFADPPRLICEKQLNGSDPPDGNYTSDRYGHPPYDEVIEFVKSLSSP